MSRPPFLPRFLLRWLLPFRDREFIIGDLDEEYALRQKPRGWLRAYAWYWRQVFFSIVSATRYELGDAPTVTAGEPRRGNLLDVLRQDVRYAVRSLNARPLFTSVAVITLALGIGANTGIFSVANWLLLRPVAGIARPDELAVIDFGEAPGQSIGISWSNFRDMREQLSSFTALTGEVTGVSLQVTANGGAFESEATAVGPDYFDVLGVKAQRGRTISNEETVPGRAAAVAVISDAFWTRHYQRDPSVLGKTLQANRTALTIVGVLPRGFRGTERLGESDIWIPYSIYGALRHIDEKEYYVRGTGIRLWQLIGRLKAGVDAAAAQVDVRRTLDQLIQKYPADNEIYKEYVPWVSAGIGIPVIMRERTQQTIKLMMIIVTLVLIISSANVANMLLVRSAQTRPEIAMRRALGASFGRIAFQSLTESVLLAIIGGILGLFVAVAFLGLIEGGRLRGLPSIENVPLDTRVLCFTIGVSVLTGVIFGCMPLNSIRRLNLSAELHRASARHTARSSVLRNAIVVTQISFSLVLLVGALLLGRTLNALLAVDSGFSADRLAGIQLNFEPQGHSADRVLLLGDHLLERVRAIPGVEQATLASSIPLSCCRTGTRVADPLQRSDQPIRLEVQYVTDGYFETMGIPLVRGRALGVADWKRTLPNEFNIVVSETAARRLFGEREALGQTLKSGPETYHVVGVARDARLHSLTDPISDLIYTPLNALGLPHYTLVLRARADPRLLEPALRQALAGVDANIPLDYHVVTDNIRDQLAERRLLASLFTMFSFLALLLAGIGLYGVLGSNVSDRRREFGIRMALGAKASRVLAMVMAHSARLVVVGVGAGLVGAFWFGRLLESQLFGVSRSALSTYMLAAGLFTAIALLATGIPTRAAIRVQPASALRQE
jgi:putative ABC transport system permease protein